MTLPVSTEEIRKRYDSGETINSISKALSVSVEVVRARLRKTGYTPRARRAAVTKQTIRMMREAMPALVGLQQFLEADRRELLAWMGDNPPRDKLERLGNLTDFIEALAEVTK